MLQKTKIKNSTTSFKLGCVKCFFTQEQIVAVHHRGSATSVNTGDINASFANDSVWSTHAETYSHDLKTARVNITIDDSSLRNVAHNSYTNGALNNAGLINFGEKAECGFKTVEAASYNGEADSALIMKTDINAKEKNDKLIVSGSAEGKSKVAVYNTKASGVERSDALILVKGDSTNAKFELGNADMTIGGISYISAGAWKYRLENSEEAKGKTASPAVATVPAREWYLIKDGTSATGDAIAQAAIQHDLWYTETNTMTKRLGIYRDDMWNGGFWIEAAANKEDFKIEKTNMLNENQNFKTGTIGYDWKSETENGATWYGIMAGYGKSNSDLVGGVGDLDVKSFHASLYAVHRKTDGLYINTILKYNKYKNEMEITHKDSFTKDLAGYDGGEWDQNGLGISLQAGRKIDLTKGWYAEPQLQLSWNRVFASDYTTKSGIKVDIDDIDYIRLRGGLVFGRQITYADGRFLDYYGDISVIHDFDGDATLRMSGAEHKSSLGGTWGTFGIGANYKYADGKFAHIRVQYSDGTSYREPITVYAGLSFETK